ncbi:MAG: Processing alpha glucosidase I [Geoglossum umbratile]|nr:MAG: Processing alpha glucosidase I [Geoglossum umbratile]
MSVLVGALEDDVSILINEIGRASNQSLLWGPYRPNLYFGTRPRVPNSLLTGLMWSKVESVEDFQHNLRHTCEQHQGMVGYGWDDYDVRKGGRQTIHDEGNNIDIQTEFIKVEGGQHGGNWGVRIRGIPRESAPMDLKTTVFFYAALEGLGSVEVENEASTLGYDDTVTLKGITPDLGEFVVDITKGPESNSHPVHSHPSYEDKPLDRTIVHSLSEEAGGMWQAKGLLFVAMKKEVDRYIEKYTVENAPPPCQLFTIVNKAGGGNLHLIQKVFEGSFEFDVLYSSGSVPVRLDSNALTKGIKSTVKSFSDRFSRVFSRQRPFDQPKYEVFARSLFSNLIGGIGYFYGDSVVDRSYAPEYEEESEGFWEDAAEARDRHSEKLEGPFELFSSIPSRPFFPRGFLWDEGFHLLPVVDWDIDLTLEIVKSWFNLMDDDGWIAREQILGPEARSKVPVEFRVQYPHYANPPTLFFVIDAFIDKLELSNGTQREKSPESLEGEQRTFDLYTSHSDYPEVALQYLRNLYPLLKRHYFWFRKTQWGDIKSYDRDAFSSKEAYRWRGRTPTHLLTSGLDDYPRPPTPHPGELHVDLISWMGMMTKVIKRIATTLGEADDAEEFSVYETAIVRNIDDLHWDKDAKTYCDATIDDYEEHAHVCHKGYISIFPFLVGLVAADSPRLGPVLDLIADPEELWSDYGLRSLSKKDELYGTGENYWCSPIWINLNYLALRRLLEYATNKFCPHQKRAKKLYTALRSNMVNTVYNSWEETGFAWEQYNPETGAGQRTQHFTGWTSLIVKVMTMPDLESGAKGGHDEL